MEKTIVNYETIVKGIKAVLVQYPSVRVALEVVLEDVELHTEYAEQINLAIEKLDNGASDVEVLKEWAEQSKNKELADMAIKIEQAHLSKNDIGLIFEKAVPKEKSNTYRKSSFARRGK